MLPSGSAKKPVRCPQSRSIGAAMASVVWTTGGCASYYVDAGGRNTVAWPHGAARFARELRRFDESEYVRT